MKSASVKTRECVCVVSVCVWMTFQFSPKEVSLIRAAAASPATCAVPVDAAAATAYSAAETAQRASQRLAACARRSLRTASVCAWLCRGAARALARAFAGGGRCARALCCPDARPLGACDEQTALLEAGAEPPAEAPVFATIRATSLLEAEVARIVVPRASRARLVMAL